MQDVVLVAARSKLPEMQAPTSLLSFCTCKGLESKVARLRALADKDSPGYIICNGHLHCNETGYGSGGKEGCQMPLMSLVVQGYSN